MLTIHVTKSALLYDKEFGARPKIQISAAFSPVPRPGAETYTGALEPVRKVISTKAAGAKFGAGRKNPEPLGFIRICQASVSSGVFGSIFCSDDSASKEYESRPSAARIFVKACAERESQCAFFGASSTQFSFVAFATS